MPIQLGAAQTHPRRLHLPNRTLTIEHLVGVGRRAAVLIDRLDEFKDLFGHDQVDEMVLDLAARLLEYVDLGAFVGRIGADCFVIVIEGLAARRTLLPTTPSA